MSYKKAVDILPPDLLLAVQEYIDGEYLYIPRIKGKKLSWGTNTQSKESIQARNKEIRSRRLTGYSVAELAKQYFLSEKTIYKIINTHNNG